MQEILSLNDFEEFRLLIWDEEQKKQIISHQIQEADLAQFSDPAFRKELGTWIGEGVFGHQWLIAKMAKLAVSQINIGRSQAKKDTQLFKGAPAIAFIYGFDDQKETQVRAGMLYQRIALFLNNFNVRTQPFSNLLEVAEIKKNVTKLFPEKGALPIQFFRLGYAEAEKKRTPRRPEQEVIVKKN